MERYIGRSLNNDDLAQYKVLTEQSLTTIKLNHSLLMCSDSECSDQTHIASIDAMYNSVICALGTASNVFMQETIMQKRYATIPGWKKFCQDAHSQARNAFLWWARSGRPRSGVIFQTMLQTRAAFKQAFRHCRRSDSRKFWKEIKIITGQDRAPLAASIGPATSPTAIAELWRGHYLGIFKLYTILTYG